MCNVTLVQQSHTHTHRAIMYSIVRKLHESVQFHFPSRSKCTCIEMINSHHVQCVRAYINATMDRTTLELCHKILSALHIVMSCCRVDVYVVSYAGKCSSRLNRMWALSGTFNHYSSLKIAIFNLLAWNFHLATISSPIFDRFDLVSTNDILQACMRVWACAFRRRRLVSYHNLYITLFLRCASTCSHYAPSVWLHIRVVCQTQCVGVRASDFPLYTVFMFCLCLHILQEEN